MKYKNKTLFLSSCTFKVNRNHVQYYVKNPLFTVTIFYTKVELGNLVEFWLSMFLRGHRINIEFGIYLFQTDVCLMISIQQNRY